MAEWFGTAEVWSKILTQTQKLTAGRPSNHKLLTNILYASQTSYEATRVRWYPSFPAAASAIERHWPWPLQSLGHNARSHARPSKPSWQVQIPVSLETRWGKTARSRGWCGMILTHCPYYFCRSSSIEAVYVRAHYCKPQTVQSTISFSRWRRDAQVPIHNSLITTVAIIVLMLGRSVGRLVGLHARG